MTRHRRLGNPNPAYFALQTQIQNDIESGNLTPGTRIPSERYLSQVHRLSVGTVTKAIMNLVHAGYLYRLQGKGTFVAGTNLAPESLRYYRYVSGFGETEAELSVKLVSLEKTKIREPVSRYLNVRSGEAGYVLRRLFFSTGEPIVYCISHLPRRLVQGLHELPESRLEKVPFYNTIEDEYKLPTLFNRELISAVRTTKEVAIQLNIPEGEPLLLIEMLSVTYKDRAYEFRQSYCSTSLGKMLREY